MFAPPSGPRSSLSVNALTKSNKERDPDRRIKKITYRTSSTSTSAPRPYVRRYRKDKEIINSKKKEETPIKAPSISFLDEVNDLLADSIISARSNERSEIVLEKQNIKHQGKEKISSYGLDNGKLSKKKNKTTEFSDQQKNVEAKSNPSKKEKSIKSIKSENNLYLNTTELENLYHQREEELAFFISKLNELKKELNTILNEKANTFSMNAKAKKDFANLLIIAKRSLKKKLTMKNKKSLLEVLMQEQGQEISSNSEIKEGQEPNNDFVEEDDEIGSKLMQKKIDKVSMDIMFHISQIKNHLKNVS